MKGKLLAFLIPVVYVFALLLVASPHQVRAIVLPGICEPISCGTTQGTKQEPVYGEVCEKGCPTVEFRASRQVCPIGYPNVSHKHKGYCYKNGANHDYLVILVLHQMALSSHSLAFSHPELGSEV